MSNELSANEVIKIVQELKSLERRFGGENGLISHLYQLNEDFIGQSLIMQKTRKELENLFQKLQDSKNLKLEIETVKLDIASKKDIDELNELIKYIKDFKTIIFKKTDEINKAYTKLNRLWLEENEVLKKIESLEKNLLSKALFGGVGIGIFLTITIIYFVRHFS